MMMHVEMRKQALLVFSSVAMQRFSMLAMTVLAARLIGANELGRFAIVYATCVTLTGFIGESLAATVNQKVASAIDQNIEEQYEWAGMILSFCVAVALGLGILVGFFAPYISRFITGATDLESYIRISGVMTLFLLPNTVINALLNAFGRNLTAAVAASAGAVASVLLGLLGAYLEGSFGMCVGFSVGTALVNIIYLAVLKRQFSRKFINLANLQKYIFSGIFQSFTFPTMATMALGGPVHWLCLSFLGSSDSGVRQIAIFTAMFQWYSILTFIPSALMNFTVPKLARAKELGDSVFRRQAMHIAMASVICAASLLTMVFLLEQFILELYGADFLNEGTALKILAACGFVGSLITVMNQILWARGKTWSNLGTALVYGIVYVVATLFLVKYADYGVTGLAVSILIASLVQSLMQGRFVLSLIVSKAEN